MYVEKSDQVAECLASAELCVAVVAPYAFKTEHNLVLSQWFWNRGKRHFILFFGNQAINGIICFFDPILRLTMTRFMGGLRYNHYLAFSPYSVFRYVFALEQYPCSHGLSFPNYLDHVQ